MTSSDHSPRVFQDAIASLANLQPTAEVVMSHPAGHRGRVVASVKPAVGLALLHLHGEDKCLEHEADVVQQGVKYVLRSDVVFAPPDAA
jgi:hypothetical protein